MGDAPSSSVACTDVSHHMLLCSCVLQAYSALLGPEDFDAGVGDTLLNVLGQLMPVGQIAHSDDMQASHLKRLLVLIFFCSCVVGQLMPAGQVAFSGDMQASIACYPNLKNTIQS